MKVKKVKSSNVSPLKKFAVPLLCIGLGVIATLSVDRFLVHAANSTIHGCVDKKGNLRVLLDNDTCDKKETPLDWNQQGPISTSNALICPNCSTRDIFARTGYTSFVDHNFDFAIISGSFSGEDLSRSSFQHAVLSRMSLNGGYGINADFSFANLRESSIQGNAIYDGAKFVSADISNGSLNHSSFKNADFSNADLTSAVLKGSDMTGANFTGVTWGNTICPDGTNSDDTNTCVGHLNP